MVMWKYLWMFPVEHPGPDNPPVGGRGVGHHAHSGGARHGHPAHIRTRAQ